METQAEPPDGEFTPSKPSVNPEASSALLESLEGLSINGAQHLLPTSSSAVVLPPPATLSPDKIHNTVPMNQSGSTRPSFSSSRRSSAAHVAQSQPSSPKLHRKSSGLSQTPERTTKPSPRRSTSQTFSPKPSSSYGPIYQEEAAPVTASSVAADYFKRELALHSDQERARPDTIVIVHDSCYGHRYSRPKTSKLNLSFIVERPERIKAGVLGLSSAYVRLGKRHSSGDYAPHPKQQLPETLPFLIAKSTRAARLDMSAVTSVHGTKWMQELTSMCNSAEAKLASGGRELTRPDTPGASSNMKPKLHEGDLYLCKESLDAFQGALGGVLDGVDAVFGENTSVTGSFPRQKKAFVCIRPPGHHCSADMPSGFCWLNNVHVGIEYAAQTYGLTHAAIIDFDLHHGDGSQAITWDRNAKAARMPKNTPATKRTAIGYYSLHDINSYPCEDGNREKVQNASLCIENAHGQSIWNIHLQPWKTEEEFWDLYKSRYLVLLDKTRAFLRAQTQRIQSSSSTTKAKAAIFISAGFDASEWEGEGMQRHKVNVPTEFYARFTADISKLAEEEGTSVEGRVISVLEGGYSDRALMSGVLSHISGLVVPPNTPGVSDQGASGADEFHECRHWWSTSALSELESLLRPTVSPPASRKIRSTELSTFATPTQSFTAKVVDPTKVYRSLSGVAPIPEQTRPPTPPPPDVDWATAAHELSKLLIPTNRTVDSCKHEELTEPRVKRDRHSSIDLSSTKPAPAPAVQTRGRKSKVPANSEAGPANNISLPKRPSSPTRRRTLSDLPMVPDDESTALLEHGAERPTTSDSKAFSDGSVSRFDPSQNSFVNPTARNPGEEIRLGRTRRQSGALADIRKTIDEAPAVPALPNVVNGVYKENTLQPTADANTAPTTTTAATANHTSDVESITSGVKKITLRMPKETQDSKSATHATKTAAKAPRKLVAPRAPKTTTNKTSVARTAKAAKAASGAPSIPPPISAPTGKIASNDMSSGQKEAAPTNQATVAAVEQKEFQLPEPVQPVPVPSDAEPQPDQQYEPVHNSIPPEHVQFNGLSGAPASQYSVYENPSLPMTSSSTTTSTTPTADMLPQEKKPGPTITSSSNIPNTHSEFIPYMPSSHYRETQPSQADVKPESLTWLPPNTNTPVQSPAPISKQRGKENNLPVFTKDGYIPFAAPQPVSTMIPEKRGDVTAVSGNTVQEETLAPSEVEAPATKDPTEQGKSIWDVPVTPSR